MEPTFDINNYFFCDIETSGLDFVEHGILEFSYAVGDANPVTLYADYTNMAERIRDADSRALEVNGYDIEKGHSVATTHLAYARGLATFAEDVKDKIWVNANPAFDARFMANELRHFNHRIIEPWHYRLFDIQAYYAGMFGQYTPASLSTITEEVSAMGFEITKPDHTSKNDVLAVRDIFTALMNLATLADLAGKSN